MYSRQMLQIAANEISRQLRVMPRNFTSEDFYTAFESNYPQHYEAFIRIYLARHHDRPHAIQIVNSQLMHTVNNRFRNIAFKTRTVRNPKGGDMSDWARA